MQTALLSNEMFSSIVLLATLQLIDTTNGQVNVECGKVQTQGSSLIRHGQKTSSGDWPWHAAIYLEPDANTRLYTCGGSLLTQFHVLTAAHCVTEADGTTPHKAEHVVVYLGLYNLNRLHEAQRHAATEIRVHPSYTVTPYNNDVAIVKTKTYADFNERVWPICRPRGELANRAGTYGVVVGWGYDERNALSDTLTRTNLPIVAFDKCLSSNEEFFATYRDQKTYCAGYRNGTSICSGDSGGGMYFNGDDAWYVSGIVSVAVYIPHTTICHASHYVLFTDASRHADWIDANLK